MVRSLFNKDSGIEMSPVRKSDTSYGEEEQETLPFGARPIVSTGSITPSSSPYKQTNRYYLLMLSIVVLVCMLG